MTDPSWQGRAAEPLWPVPALPSHSHRDGAVDPHQPTTPGHGAGKAHGWDTCRRGRGVNLWLGGWDSCANERPAQWELESKLIQVSLQMNSPLAIFLDLATAAQICSVHHSYRGEPQAAWTMLLAVEGISTSASKFWGKFKHGPEFCCLSFTPY